MNSYFQKRKYNKCHIIQKKNIINKIKKNMKMMKNQ